MKDEDYEPFRGYGLRLEGGIHTAVELWCADPAAAKAQYGPIASWDTSEITNMRWLFAGRAGFNDDIHELHAPRCHIVHPPAWRGMVDKHG